MKKLVFLIMIITIIAGIGVYIYYNRPVKPDVQLPVYETTPPENITSSPVETSTTKPTVSTIYFTPVTDSPVMTTSQPTETEIPQTTAPSDIVITEKDYSRENNIFLFKGVPIARLRDGQWIFDSYNVLPSEILGVPQYYTYNYKGVKNVTNTIYATVSKKYKKFIGTFAEGFEKIASTYDSNTFTASFNLPFDVPENMDTSANFIDKDITFKDDSYFATSASYDINFVKVTANQYDPFKITNMSNNISGTYNRSSITLPDDVKDYVANYMLNHFIALDVNYEVSYVCETDFDHDGSRESLYVFSSNKGDKEIEYDYIGEYGHFNLVLLKDGTDIYEIDESSVAQGLQRDEIINTTVYADTFYDPCVVDMNGDGIYEILICKGFDGGSSMHVYIYDNGKYIKAN